MKNTAFALLALGLTCVNPASASPYSRLVKEWKGANFFQGWDFQSGWDYTTHGQANYLSSGDAAAQKLAYVNSAGNAVIKVDSTTSLAAGANRNSIRITSQQTFNQNQVLILDAVHAPFGCSTWPAFWTCGTNWPNNGEIDIYEGVHRQSNNQVTLHTRSGCTKAPGTTQTGTTLTTNCDANVNYNAGCGVRDSSSSSYGAGFAAAGGGVYAVQWGGDGLYMWFFPRNSIPADINANAPDPAKWGTPTANFYGSTCNPASFFGPQNIIFDITLCGDWAGEANTWAASGCGGTCSDWVKNPANFKDAYFEVKRVAIFGV